MFALILIAILCIMVLRWVWIFVSTFFATWREIDNTAPKLDVEALRRDLQGKTKAELWDIRNEYFGYLTESIDTPQYRFFLDAIGEVDKIIFSLKDQKKGLST